MMHRLLRIVGAVAGIVIVGGAIYLLREATMSTHYDTGDDSHLVVVVRAASNRPEEGVRLEEMATAQIELCALEVSRAGDVEVVAEDDDRFVVTLRPALDSTDRKQYRGCLEDWNVDHLRVDVESMQDVEADDQADDDVDGVSDAPAARREGGA
jgi:hypothetical protein